MLEKIIKDAVEKDAPKVAWPAIENASAPLLAKLVQPLSLDPLIFCPATLNVSLAAPCV